MKEQIIKFIETIRPSPAVLIIDIVVLIHFLFCFYISRQTSSTVLPSILLTGPPQSSKTALFLHLEAGGGSSLPPVSTSTSSRGSVFVRAIELSFSNTSQNTSNDDVNEAHNLHHRDSTRFVVRDSASNLKARHNTMGFIASGAFPQPGSTSSKLRAIVYVVDAAALGNHSSVSKPKLQAAGEYLYTLLLTLQKRHSSSKRSKIPAPISVMIAANKAELFTALPEASVCSVLEAELSSIRKSKSKTLPGSNTDGDDGDEWLGAYGTEKFSFDQMREFGVDIDVISGNVMGDTNGPNTERWWRWMTAQIQ